MFMISWKFYPMAVQPRHAWLVNSVVSWIIFDLILLYGLDAAGSGELTLDDILTPYKTSHGPLLRQHRDTQACQSVRYGNVTHTKHPAHNDPLNQLPVVETHYMMKEIGAYSWDKKLVYINHQVVNNPLSTWSVLEPAHLGTCQNGTGENGTAERATVEVSAQQKKCLVASNGGFFNTHTGQCLGNVVSDGILVQDSGGIQNVHFGLTRDGYIFTGYLSELDLLVQDFTQLVGGVVWLVRDGVKYVDESKAIECPDTEETGTVERFITVLSARNAVGHDAAGRVHMVQVSGKTDTSGVDLHKFSDLLLELGLVNAINLDGGGSTTTVINGTLASYPSDQCANSSYNCARNVSTILCVHLPDCTPGDCSGHGLCDMGVCRCQGHWSGPSCDLLVCPGDCSWHGQCTQDGCQCYQGWKGENCSLACDSGWYGTNCSLPCRCGGGTTCNPITGVCKCPAGYTGRYCLSACPVGYFGSDCHQVCDCRNACLCDPVTGDCNVTVTDSDLLAVGHCLAKQEIKQQHLAPDTRQQYDLCMASLLGVAVLVTASLTLNVLLVYLLVRLSCKQQEILDREVRLAVKRSVHKMLSVTADSENDDEDDKFFYCKKQNKTDDILHVVINEEEEEEEENVAGSGEDEEDLFLAPHRGNGRAK